MLRRTAASLVLTVALWSASLAWAGFVALRTVLDPDRSRAVAEAVYEDDSVRDRIADNLAEAVAAAIGDRAPVTDDQLRAAARRALASEAVGTGIVDVLVAVHRGFLGEGEIPDSFELAPLEESLRQAVAERDPALAQRLGSVGDLAVDLPTERVPDLGTPRRWLARAVPVLAVVGLVGIVLALVATSDRRGVLARTGRRALFLAGGLLLVAVGLPRLIGVLAPAQAEVAAALAGAMLASALGPAVALAVVGTAMLMVAKMWPGDAAVRAPRPAAPRPGDLRRPQDLPRSVPPTDELGRSLRPPPAPSPWTAVARPGRGQAPGRAPRLSHPVRWREGVGWVLDPAEPDIPEEARWVAGVGWVLDQPGSEPG